MVSFDICIGTVKQMVKFITYLTTVTNRFPICDRPRLDTALLSLHRLFGKHVYTEPLFTPATGMFTGVVHGYCLIVASSSIINKTSKWFTQLPILLQESFRADITVMVDWA